MFLVCVKIICSFCHLGSLSLFSRNNTWIFFGNALPLYAGLMGVCQVASPSSGLRRSSWILSPRNVKLEDPDSSWLAVSGLTSEEGLWTASPWFLSPQPWLSNFLWFSEPPSNNCVHKNHPEGWLKIKRERSIPEVQVLWVWDVSRDLNLFWQTTTRILMLVTQKTH